MKKMEDMSRKEEKKRERQRGTPVNEERKKQGHLVPAPVLTPNTLTPC